MSQPPGPPVVVVCANQAWNLVNFRADLIKALIAAGCKVVAAAPPDPAMQARLEQLGAEFEPLPIDAKGLAPHRDLATIWAIRKLLVRRRPDAWLSWTIKPNVYGALVAGALGIPALPNVSGLGTAFIRRNLLTLAAKQLYRMGFRRAPVVFFQNGTDRDEFVDAGLVASGQVRLLPGSGVDPTHFAPPPEGRPGHRRFLMLSRVVADKGVREFVEAARLTRKNWPDSRFILMGEVGAPNRTAVARPEVEEWIAEGVIEHLDPVSDVRPQIAAADFVVLPSYREGLSRVLVEAGAMGRPAITTDVPGCRDIVTEGVNGFLCAARSGPSLAAALERAARLADSDWDKMAQAARERVVSQFSTSAVVALYLQALVDAGIVLPNFFSAR